MTTELKDKIVAEIKKDIALGDDYRDINYLPMGKEGLEVGFNILCMFHFSALEVICKKYNCRYYLTSPSLSKFYHLVQIRLDV